MIPRAYKSPFGMVGAVVSLLVWILCGISILGFQHDDGAAFIGFFGLISLLSMYYYFVGRHHQTFSEDERKALMPAHVINCKSHFEIVIFSQIEFGVFCS
jgi:hypothetical protein